MSSLRGIISNIQRMSLQDGPGIRTTVFLKGCNMRCVWCHNPEAIHPDPEYVFNPDLCLKCGCCEQGCYSGARLLCGREMSVEQVMQEVNQDLPYYSDNGGLTVSGGEPFFQAAFLIALLKAAKESGIHCGVETNAAHPLNILEKALPFVDIWMIDLKAFSDEIHRQYTGVSNETVKCNIKELDSAGARIVLRTPIVPGVNDSVGEIEKIAAFAARLKGLVYYEALPYHALGLSKKIERSEFIKAFPTVDLVETKQMLRPIIERYNIPIRFANAKMSGANTGSERNKHDI